MSKAPRPTPITGNSCCPGTSVSRAYRPIARRCSSPPRRRTSSRRLRERLREVAQRVDATYPANTALTIDEEGTPHLKRLPAQPVPEDLPTLEALLKARLPERHLLDILKNVQYWVGYTRHFGPPSGADPKLTDPVLRYIFTVFGYASELGASQTARHTDGPD